MVLQVGIQFEKSTTMKRTIGIILVVAGLLLGYMGYTSLEDSKAEIEIGDLELSAQDKDSQATSYIYFGLGALALIGGIVMASKKN